MWQKLTRRLTDPLFYRKRWLQALRPLRQSRATRPISLDHWEGKPGPVLVVIAHPDDELFASSLLCELAERGREFHFVCLTRGEGGLTGNATRENLGPIREAELQASAAILGSSSITFLGHVDPLGKTHRTYAPPVSVKDLARQIQGLIEGFQPILVVTHGSGGEYWHPAHVLVHRAVLQAVGTSLHVLTIHAWQDGHALPGLLNREDPADLIVDGLAHREKRLAAFRAHHTQHEYFIRHCGSVERFVDLTAREGFCHYGPA